MGERERLTDEERHALRKLMGDAVCGSFGRMDYRILRALLDERDALAAELARVRSVEAAPSGPVEGAPDDHEADPMHAVAEMDPVTEMSVRFEEIDRRDPEMLERMALEAKTRAERSTPLPWRWWTSCSLRRLSSDPSGKDGDVAHAVEHHDGCLDISIREEDMELIEHAVNNHAADAALRLLEQNKRLKAKAQFMEMAMRAGSLPTSALASGEPPGCTDDASPAVDWSGTAQQIEAQTRADDEAFRGLLAGATQVAAGPVLDELQGAQMVEAAIADVGGRVDVSIDAPASPGGGLWGSGSAFGALLRWSWTELEIARAYGFDRWANSVAWAGPFPASRAELRALIESALGEDEEPSAGDVGEATAR